MEKYCGLKVVNIGSVMVMEKVVAAEAATGAGVAELRNKIEQQNHRAIAGLK